VKADSLREVIVEDACHLIWPCRQKAGLGAVVLRFLGLAELAEKVGGIYGIHLDATAFIPYGDLSTLLQLPRHVADQYALQAFASSSFPRRRWQGFANGRVCREGRPHLSETDVTTGRRLCRQHLSINQAVLRALDSFATTMMLSMALGVHIRRTDKGCEAPSNLFITAEEAARKALKAAVAVGVRLIFLAGDDPKFLADVQAFVSADVGMKVIAWPSRLSQRGRAVHYDWQVPGTEAAADALADAFCLSRCRGLLSTFSCLSAWATLLSSSGFVWWHFRYPHSDEDPWSSSSFPCTEVDCANHSTT